MSLRPSLLFASLPIASLPVATVIAAFVACSPAPTPVSQSAASATPQPSASASNTVNNAANAPFDISLIGTSDLHGHIDALPILGGFVGALRQKVGDDHVLLVDAGDMFQGTLESNMSEGAAVVRAYNVLHYDAVAIGNHEFDFGPVGSSAVPRTPTDDPRGALEQRAMEARFPFLMANVVDTTTGKPPAYSNILASTVVEKHGAKIGIIGVTSVDTPRTTIALNFGGLGIIPLAEAVLGETKSLRARGADFIVLAAHAGGKCKNVTDPTSAGDCEEHQEIMALLHALPKGTLEAVVAGHTHQGMATVVDGVPIIQSYANGHGFGRIDLTFDPQTRKVVHASVRALTELKLPATYEGADVAPSAEVARAFQEDLERAKARKEQKLGVHLEAKIRRNHDHECAEGNLFADLMLGSHPKADVAITNGGGLRADLPEGDLTYGSLFEAMPFDNRFASLPMTGAELRRVLTANAMDDHGLLSVAGIFVEASCKAGKPDIAIYRRSKKGERGALVRDADKLNVVTSDFIALGGDKSGIPKDHLVLEDDLIRDAFEKGLTNRGVLREKDVFDPAHPRWKLPGERPMICAP